MITFDLALSDTWQDVLNGGTFLAFDVLSYRPANKFAVTEKSILYFTGISDKTATEVKLRYSLQEHRLVAT